MSIYSSMVVASPDSFRLIPTFVPIGRTITTDFEDDADFIAAIYL